jgi:transcriptional regulator with XRE-family HTH domain
MPNDDARLFPALLRYWRGRRGMSQLDLALAADVSPRHLSFLETGRAKPGRDMVLRLGATLSMPLRDQNEMLRAAGFPPAFGEPSAADDLPPPIARAIDRIVAAHEPFPILLLDRHYDVLRTSLGAARVLGHFMAEPTAMPARLNALAALFDPRLARPFVVDWERIAHALIARLYREALARPSDTGLGDLLRSLFEYPGVPESWRQPDFSAPNDPVLTLRLRKERLELAFLTTITAFNAPGNVTLEELRIESYFPLDEVSERACVELSRD